MKPPQFRTARVVRASSARDTVVSVESTVAVLSYRPLRLGDRIRKQDERRDETGNWVKVTEGFGRKYAAYFYGQMRRLSE